MSAPYIIPFNHQPSTTSQGSTSYVVPAGKYARATVHISCEFAVNLSVTSTLALEYTGGKASKIDVWLKAGDTLSGGVTNAASPVVPTATTAVLTSSAFATVAGNTIAAVSAMCTYVNQTGGNVTVTSTNANSFYYHIEEYNVIS